MFRSRFHTPGLLYLGLLLMVGLAAMNNQNNLLFWVFGVLCSGLVLSWLVATALMRAISVRRVDPQHGAVGEPLIVHYALSNQSRLLSAFNVHIEERQGQRAGDWRRIMPPARAWVMHAGPRETVHGEAVFWPMRRGKIGFDQIRARTTFPFGIMCKSRTFAQPQHTLVYPQLYELRRGLLSSIVPAGLLGSKVSQHTGAGDDYFGMREFKPGDSLRHIAWKRTARSDELITIERTAPSPAKLRVILNLAVPTDQLRKEPPGLAAGRELEERAISLAASIIHAADLDGYEIGLTIMGFDAVPIAVRRNQWHLNKMMAALAAIDLERPRVQPRPQPIRDAERAGLVVISPDRARPLPGREDAWYLTARHLDSLAVRAIGWTPAPAPSEAPRSAPVQRVAEAVA